MREAPNNTNIQIQKKLNTGAKIIKLALLFVAVLTSNTASSSEQQEEKNKLAATKFSDIAENLDEAYVVIFGRMDASSFFVHYCGPEFKSIKLGGCKINLPAGKGSDLIQVNYFNQTQWKDKSPQNLEGYTNFKFPFSSNASVPIQNPYKDLYEKSRLDEAKKRPATLSLNPKSILHPDLEWYTEKYVHGGWWVPKDKAEIETDNGNPPIFGCFEFFCNSTIDLGNGWIAEARFNEAFLDNWREFYKSFKNSTEAIIKN